jgi:translation elongation factor EF-G
MLHLEVTLNKLKAAHNVDVKVSEPQVSYNQTLDSYARSAEVSVRSPNKHNDFRFQIFKLPDNVIKRLLKNQISAKTLNTELEKEGFPRALANAAVKSLDYGCIYFEQTHGADFMEECKNLIAKSITLALDKGILMKKPLKGIGFVITYAKIHEDPLHRTITQLRSAFREGLQKILKELNPSVINEPIMKLCVRVPSIYLENVSGTISNKRGYLLETESDSLSGYLNLTYEIPLAETFDISPKLMSTSEGRATFTMEFERFEKVSPQVLDKLKKRNLVQNLE